MLVFCYGTLCAGRGNHHLLSDAKFVDNAITMDKFTMIDVGFPVVRGPDPKGGHVMGEVYQVDAKTLKMLDRFEGEGAMYVRQRRAVKLSDSQQTVQAYYYVGIPAAWNDRRYRPVQPTADGLLGWRT